VVFNVLTVARLQAQQENVLVFVQPDTLELTARTSKLVQRDMEVMPVRIVVLPLEW